MQAANASVKEYAQVLPVNGGCFPLISFPGRLSNVGEKSESPPRAQAHSGHSRCKDKQQREKGDYRQLGPQPVVSANSSIQSPKHPNSPCIWIPSGLRELRGAGWTKHFSWNSSHRIQTSFCSPGCRSSFHLKHLFGPGWIRKKLFPFLYTSRESLLPASCF